MAPSAKAGLAAVFRFDFAGFDALDETAGNALVCLFFESLPDLAADDRSDVELIRLADAFEPAAFRFAAERLPDFLRVFLDIRLPFVAFRGSIIDVLRQVSRFDYRPVNLAFSDYAQKDFDTPPARRRGSRMTGERANPVRFNMGAEAFANTGIEGLFANIGFSGLGDLRFALGPVVE